MKRAFKKLALYVLEQVTEGWIEMQENRRINKAYRLANKEIDKAVKMATTKNKTYYVLPLPDGFKAMNNSEIKLLKKLGVIPSSVSVVYLLKAAVYIARPKGGVDVKKGAMMEAYIRKRVKPLW